ncbi:MAG TPA: hypothetical protein VLM37_11855 [Fibrobacteraceae bacterium]|nr:hypothetical protein [Fibrobacteraceae bacterium]
MGNTKSLFWAGILACMALSVAAEVSSSVPLSHQSQYLPHGLQGGIGIGELSRNGCQSRFQWRGSVEYSYSEHISAGGAVRMFGGDVDSLYSLTYTRYYGYARYHVQPKSTLDFFIGPVISLDNTNIQSIREDIIGNESSETKDSIVIDDASECQEAFATNGPGLGTDMGLGWVFQEPFAMTAFYTFEHTFPSKTRMSFGFGFAFDIRKYWRRLEENLLSAWLHLDFTKAVNFHSSGSENSLILGVSAGF